MKKNLVLSAIFVLIASQMLFAHDPRTVAKTFSHSMEVEGAGKLTLTYKSLHWNEPAYMNMKTNAQLRQRVNALIWKKIGKLDAGFDVVLGGVQVPKGSYDFGINFDDKDNFTIILGAGGKDISIPLTTASDSPLVSYLTFDLRPTDSPDTFTVEGRGGKFRASAEMKVPYLSSHDHKDGKEEHKHEDKPAAKKP
jgi:hypothetical protein